jgi:hypothetical protein
MVDLALLLTTQCPPVSYITHGPDDVYSEDYSDNVMGPGSGPDSTRDRGDVEEHLLQHGGRSEAGFKGRLILVSKYLSEIASTEGTIWMVSMVCEREQQIEGGQIKDIGRGSRDETQRGYIWGYMMQINMIERTLNPEGEEQVAHPAFCKYASSVPRSELGVAARIDKHLAWAVKYREQFKISIYM